MNPPQGCSESVTVYVHSWHLHCDHQSPLRAADSITVRTAQKRGDFVVCPRLAFFVAVFIRKQSFVEARGSSVTCMCVHLYGCIELKAKGSLFLTAFVLWNPRVFPFELMNSLGGRWGFHYQN